MKGKSKNPLAFRWYNPEQIVSGKKMKVPSFCDSLLAFILRHGKDSRDATRIFPWDNVTPKR